jgi:hypothetical protein
MTLTSKIRAFLGRDVDFKHEVVVTQYPGSDPEITAWNAPEDQPTVEQLDAVAGTAAKETAQRAVVADRREAYGSLESQIEFITENGLEAWQSKVAEIKTQFPKA